MDSSPQRIINPNSMAYCPQIFVVRGASRPVVWRLLPETPAPATRKADFWRRSKPKVGKARREFRASSARNLAQIRRLPLCPARRDTWSPMRRDSTSKPALRLEQVGAEFDLAVGTSIPIRRIGGRKHARGGAGVPGPAAAPAVAIAVVDVGRLLGRDQAVDRDRLRRRSFQRRDLFENLECARREPRGGSASPRARAPRGEPHEAVDDPGGAVAVLAAVLAHARRIVGDAARIGLRMFEERRLQQKHAVRPLDPLEAAFERRERALVIARRRNRRPSRSSSRCGIAERLPSSAKSSA